MIRVFPFGIFTRKPEPNLKSAGTSASSWYSNSEAAINGSENRMYVGIESVDSECGEIGETNNPSLALNPVINPRIFADVDLSADTNKTSTGTASVIQRWNNNAASLGGIVLSLMAEEVSPKEAEWWCERLGLSGQGQSKELST